MSSNTTTVGFKSILSTFLSNMTYTQAEVSVVTCSMLVYTPGQINANQNTTAQLQFSENGVYKIYVHYIAADTTLRFYSMAGVELGVLSATGSITLTKDVSELGKTIIIQQTNSSLYPMGWVNVGVFGFSRMQSLKDFVQNEEIENMLLPMQAGESFTKTSNGVIMQLNRTFTEGTQLLLYRFTAARAGSLYVSSNNPYLVETDPYTTSFTAGQNFGDTVTIKNTTTTPTPLTLTLVIVGVGTEQPLNTRGYPL